MGAMARRSGVSVGRVKVIGFQGAERGIHGKAQRVPAMLLQ